MTTTRQTITINEFTAAVRAAAISRECHPDLTNDPDAAESGYYICTLTLPDSMGGIEYTLEYDDGELLPENTLYDSPPYEVDLAIEVLDADGDPLDDDAIARTAASIRGDLWQYLDSATKVID